MIKRYLTLTLFILVFKSISFAQFDMPYLKKGDTKQVVYKNTSIANSKNISYDQSTKYNIYIDSSKIITSYNNTYIQIIKEKEKELDSSKKIGSYEYLEQQILKAELTIDKIILANYDSIKNASLDKALSLINTNISIINKRNRSELEKAFAYSEKAKIFAKENLRDSALFAINICEKYIGKTKHTDTKKLGLVYFNLANNYLNLDSINKAIEFNLKSLELNQSFLPANDSIFIQQYWLQSLLHYSKQEYELSLENINKSLKIIELNKQKGFFTSKLRSLIFLKLKKYEESLEDALVFRSQIFTKSDSSYLVEIDNLINFNLLNLDRYSEIPNYVFEEKKINESINNKDALIDTYYILGQFYKLSGRSDSAIFYFKKVIEIRENLKVYNNGRTIIEDYTYLFELYLSNKDYDNAEITLGKIKNNDFEIELNEGWLFDAEYRLLIEKLGLSDVQKLLNKNKYEDAIKILQNKTYQIEESRADSSLQNIMKFAIYSILSECYFETNKLKLGQLYLDKSLNLFQNLQNENSVNNENTVAYKYFLLSNFRLQFKKHSILNQPDSAIVFLKKIIIAYEENFEENYEYISGAYQMISSTYANELNNLDSAIFYITKSIEIEIKVDEISNSLFKEKLIQRGEYYLKLKDYSKALNDFEFAYEIELKNSLTNSFFNQEMINYIEEGNQIKNKLTSKEKYLKAECYYFLNDSIQFQNFFDSEFENYLVRISKEKSLKPSSTNNFWLIPDKENNIKESDSIIGFQDTSKVYESGTFVESKSNFFYYGVLNNPLENIIFYQTQNRFDFTSIDTMFTSGNDSTLKRGLLGTFSYNNDFILNFDSVQTKFLIDVYNVSISRNELELSKICLDLLSRFSNWNIEFYWAKYHYINSNYENSLFHINQYKLNSIATKTFLINEFPKLKKNKEFKKILDNPKL